MFFFKFLFPIFIGGCYSLFEMGKTPFHLVYNWENQFSQSTNDFGISSFFCQTPCDFVKRTWDGNRNSHHRKGARWERTQLKTPMYPCCMILWFKPQQHWHSTSQTCDKVIHWLLQTSWVYISRWKDSFWSETTAPLTPDAALPIMPTAFVAEATTSTATSETTTTTTTTTRTTESASVPWRSWKLESSVPCS